MWTRFRHVCSPLLVLLVIVDFSLLMPREHGLLIAAEPMAKAAQDDVAAWLPSRYIVNYPAAERFCPPIATAFYDAEHTEIVIRGKVERWRPNGGYGVAMMERKGVPLLHTGADLGWFRVGAPVYAIADGVVRISSPGIKQINAQLKLKLPLPNGPVDYGNVIVIEHRTPENEYFLSLYGHLGNDRLVRPGDIVTAGQVIGSIGKEAGNVNGGYKPHCHFAIHEGRYFEPGMVLFHLKYNGDDVTVRLAELGEKEVRVTFSRDIPDGETELRTGQTFEWRKDGEQYVVSSLVLWNLANSTGARLAGYQPTVEGFRDPIRFLRDVGAERNPAPVLQCTPLAPLTLPAVVGRPAPELPVDEWLQPATEPPSLAELRGKVVCLVFYQLTCPGSNSHGVPALRELATKSADDGRVQVIGVHVASRDFRRNAPTNAAKAIQTVGLSCPVAHIGDAKRPPRLDAFGVRATPWVTLIAPSGEIEFSNQIIRPSGIIERIEELLEKPACGDAE